MYLIDRDWCMISTRASVLLYTQFFQYVHVYSSICTVACGQSRDALLSWRWTDLSVNCLRSTVDGSGEYTDAPLRMHDTLLDIPLGFLLAPFL